MKLTNDFLILLACFFPFSRENILFIAAITIFCHFIMSFRYHSANPPEFETNLLKSAFFSFAISNQM